MAADQPPYLHLLGQNLAVPQLQLWLAWTMNAAIQVAAAGELQS